MADRKSLKQKNLKFFKQTDPSLHNILINHEPASELVFGDDGEPDILVDEKLLYAGKASEFADRQVGKFMECPDTYSILPHSPGQLDRYGNQFLGRLDERAHKSGVKFVKELPLGKCFFLVVFGIGLGKHIDALIDSTDPYYVIFIEPDRDHFVHSAEVYPWHALFNRLQKKGGRPVFIFSDKPELLAIQISQKIRQISPAAIDGTPVFIHTYSETVKEATRILQLDASYIHRGMGFFYDESLMMKNTYLNLRAGTDTLFVRTEEIDIETPVFVIGAGPSLDRDLAFIRENAEKVIIISTGTALRSLLANGITPDFHLEIENIHVYSSMVELASKFDLSPICLVAPVTIDPHITKFFDMVVYFFRSSLSPFPLFCTNDIHCLSEGGPSVINASLSLAIDIGAKDICLFGTDFGTRGDGHPDHAKDNVLFTEEAVQGFRRDYYISVPGNFGGAFFTSDDFFLALKAANETIFLHGRNRQFTNCSDGALLEKAQPARSDKLSYNSTAARKKADLQRIRERFTIMPKDWFDACWNEVTLRDVINTLADDLGGLFDKPSAFQDDEFLARYTFDMRNMRDPKMTSLGEPKRGDRVFVELAISTMFNGTIDVILMNIRSRLRLVPDPAQLLEYQEIVRDEHTAIVEAMRQDALAVINDPSDIPPPKTDPEWNKDDVLAEQDYTWGHVPRNAPCPCNSGKRYKHCHGKLVQAI